MNRFALLRLPTVALIEVLKCLNPIGLIVLAHCSRKIVQLIPFAGTKKVSLEINFRKLKLTMNNKYVFRIVNDVRQFYSKPNHLVFIFREDSDMANPLRISGFNISGLFKCPIKRLKFGSSSGQCRSIIEQVMATQNTPLENLNLDGDFESEDLKWILKNANVSGKLYIRTEKLHNISVDLKLNCRYFLLDSASWITVDNLVSLTTCVTIHLLEANLTYQDLDIVMEKWKSGLFPNLEFLLVISNSLEDDGTICGISKEELSSEKGFRKKKTVDNEHFGICTGGVDFTNDDGMKGSIQIVHSVFKFFVWKD